MVGGCYGFERWIIATKPLYSGEYSNMLHMLPETNDSETQLSKYLAWKDKAEVSKPNLSEKEKKDETPKMKDEKPEWVDKKNDVNNEYEYSDKTDEDDTQW